VKSIQLDPKFDDPKSIGVELFLTTNAQHSNVVVCKGCSIHEGLLHLYLEYLDGGSLSRFVGVPITDEAYILVSKLGEIKLCDFGSATRTNDPPEFVFHTWRYKAPELFSGIPASHSADIWALGVAALELSMGVHPFLEMLDEFELNLLLSEELGDTFCVKEGENAPPTSALLTDMIRLMLTMDPAARPTAEILLDHPAMRSVVSSRNEYQQELAAWVTAAEFSNSPTRHKTSAAAPLRRFRSSSSLSEFPSSA